MAFLRKKGKEERKEEKVEKKVEEGHQAIASIASSLSKEKYYTDEVISAAMSEYIQGLDGRAEGEKMAALISSSNRTTNVRRLCVKALLSNSFLNSDLPDQYNPNSFAQELFLKLEIRDNESLNRDPARYLQHLCQAIGIVLSEGEYGEDDVFIALSRKEFFCPNYWSVSELNRQSLGSLPSLTELILQLRRAASKAKEIRSRSIDLGHLLDILATAPHKLVAIMPVMMSPLLKNSKSPDEAMEQLNKGLKVVEENLVWNDKTMPATIANIQKHPGIPLASEVAKCLPFSELYGVFVNVITKLLLSDERGFDKCEMKIKFRLGQITFGELKRNSMSAAFSITDIMAAGDEIDEEDTGGPSKAKGKKKKKGKKLEEEIEDDHKAVAGLMGVQDYRRLFDLNPMPYDKDGNLIGQITEKNRAHSFIADAILVPFLKGLYEARAQHLNLELSIDEIFTNKLRELKLEREETRSLDEKRTFKKIMSSIRRTHFRIVSVIQECVGKTDTEVQLQLEMALSTVSQLSLDPSILHKLATSDVLKVRESKKVPAEARNLLELSRDYPEGVENVPKSSWVPFFIEGLRSVGKYLKEAGAVHEHMSKFSDLVAVHLSSVVASSIPVKEGNSEVLVQDPHFCASVKTAWEIALAQQKDQAEINTKIVNLMKDVFKYTRASKKAKSPDELCYQMLSVTRPFVSTLMGFLHKVNGEDLFHKIEDLKK